MKKKVVFLTAKMSIGGAERVISNLVNSMSSEIEVHTLLLSKQTDEDYPLKGKVVSLYDGKKRSRLMEIPYFCKKIKEYVDANNIDNIISFMEYPNLLNLLTPVKVRKIISVRNFMSEKWKGRRGFFWRLSFKLYRKADIIVCPTENILEDMNRNYNIQSDKLKLIYNPYNIEKLLTAAKENVEEKYNSWFNGNTIITMGNLSFAKGHCHLIRCLPKVKEYIPDAKLVILGKGEYHEKLEQLAKSLNLHDDVLFLGFQKNPHKYIIQSDVYVLSSYYEGFPNALVEAMVCGVPIISTDCKSGPREILAPTTNFNKTTKKIEYADYGVLIPTFKKECLIGDSPLSDEEEFLAEAIIELIKNKGIYYNYERKLNDRVFSFHIKNTRKLWIELLN